jgi:hypothetical protein
LATRFSARFAQLALAHFLPVDRHVRRGVDCQPDMPAVHPYDPHHNIVANHHGFVQFAA